MRRVKQGAATRMHSGRLDPVGLTINFKMTPSRFNHFHKKKIEKIEEEKIEKNKKKNLKIKIMTFYSNPPPASVNSIKS